MRKREKEVWEMFYRFIYYELSLREFISWLYRTSTVQDVIGVEQYQALLSFDCQQKGAVWLLKSKIRSFWEEKRPGELERERAKRIAEGIIKGTEDLVFGCWELATLHNKGHDYIPFAFVDYDHKLQDVPIPAQYAAYNHTTLAKKLQQVDLYAPEIMRSAQQLLQILSER